jgi:hypothetical protein
MPSTRPLAALAVAVLVATSGCSMLACGSDPAGPSDEALEIAEEPAPPTDGPDYHRFVYGSYTDEPYEGNVTITRANRTVYRHEIDADGNGTYVNLTTVGRAAEYTVTVNTTLPGFGGGLKSKRFTVDAELGCVTAIRTSYLAIENETFSLPREPMPRKLTGGVGDNTANATVELYYRGELVNRTRVSIDSYTETVTSLRKTGIYWVRVEAEEMTETRIFLLTDQLTKVDFMLDSSDGRVPCLEKGRQFICTL